MKCKTCSFWQPLKDNTEYGKCTCYGKVYRCDGDPKFTRHGQAAMIIYSSDMTLQIITGYDFGCIHYNTVHVNQYMLFGQDKDGKSKLPDDFIGSYDSLKDVEDAASIMEDRGYKVVIFDKYTNKIIERNKNDNI